MKLISILFLFLSFNLLASEKVLRVCWEDYVPYQMKTQTGVGGIDIDLLSQIASNLKIKLVFENVPWKRCLVGIEKGVYDIATGAAISTERKVFAHFSDGYFATSNVLFTKIENSKKYNTNHPKDLAGDKEFVLGVVRGFEYGDEVNELFKLRNKLNFKNSIVELDSEEILFNHIANSKISGMYSDEIAGQFLLRKLKLDKVIVPIKNKLISEDAYFIFSKKTLDEKFVKSFKVELKKLKVSGHYKSLIKKYLN